MSDELPRLSNHQADLLDQCETLLSKGRIERRQFMALAIGLGVGGAQATTMAEQALRVQQNQETLAKALRTRYDYIVCGSGSAGSVIAGELARRTGALVLLLEAGGTDLTPNVTNPVVWPRNLWSDLDWKDLSEPAAGLDGRRIRMNTGKVLGGGSSINAANYSRGHRADYEFWAAETGDPAWNYASALDIFKRLENWQGPADPQRRGRGGPVWVQPAANLHPGAVAMLDAAAKVGIPRFEDANGAILESMAGAAPLSHSIQDGRRRNMPSNFLYPVMDRPNLTVLTGASVDRLVIQRGRATGVVMRWQGRLLTIETEREVIVSTGALNTPKLLMLSGIGDERQLKPLGIPLVLHRPEVGQNLQDNIFLAGCLWEYKEALPPRAGVADAMVLNRTRSDLDGPNMYTVHTQNGAASPEITRRHAPPPTCWGLAPGLMRTESRGSVGLVSTDPDARPRVNAPYLNDANDVRALIHGVEFARELGNSPTMREFVKREVLPGPLKGDEMAAFVRDATTTYFHTAGTCRMGKDDGAVVDAKLKLRGIEGLRVADSSVMPRLATGPIMAPCMLIGQRLVDVLLTAGR
ncbi:GMC family oxidoreductase [Aquabacterium sp.]|uniref:GMC family oxidoreductase n=1 Tax=Aquabacterium sp. TaxID=1872578 RepID=UPI002C12283E|nr:GMC family oxidoreductase N-terminal domain-containing protein [Aquabacterium sp.]HSW06142.1 GMC family oxidoreductase N-terminal domain-containing protein [Aquabacterium sp.]